MLDDNGELTNRESQRHLVAWLGVLLAENNPSKRFALELEWGMNGALQRLPVAAVEWYQKAAEGGDVVGNLKLAFHYFAIGEFRSTQFRDNLDEAFARGDLLVLLFLSWYYQLHSALRSDSLEKADACEARARTLAEVAVRRRDPDGALCLRRLEEWKVHDVDFDAARRWFEMELEWRLEKAAAGDSIDQYFAARMLSYSKYAKADLEHAAYWYERSAIAGHPLAQREIGHCYLDGRGVTASREKALSWLSMSKAQGIKIDARPPADY